MLSNLVNKFVKNLGPLDAIVAAGAAYSIYNFIRISRETDIGVAAREYTGAGHLAGLGGTLGFMTTRRAPALVQFSVAAIGASVGYGLGQTINNPKLDQTSIIVGTSLAGAAAIGFASLANKGGTLAAKSFEKFIVDQAHTSKVKATIAGILTSEMIDKSVSRLTIGLGLTTAANMIDKQVTRSTREQKTASIQKGRRKGQQYSTQEILAEENKPAKKSENTIVVTINNYIDTAIGR